MEIFVTRARVQNRKMHKSKKQNIVVGERYTMCTTHTSNLKGIVPSGTKWEERECAALGLTEGNGQSRGVW